MRRTATLLFILMSLHAYPLLAQQPQEHQPDPSTPTAIAIPPSSANQRFLALVAWMHSLQQQEFPVALEHSEPFEPRIYIRSVLVNTRRDQQEDDQTFAEVKKVVHYDLLLYGPADRVIAWTQMHTGRNVGERGLPDTSTWTASFRYIPPFGTNAPETISTYTFEFNKIRSEHFLFSDFGLRKPEYKNTLRPVGPPACIRDERERPFTEVPPFRLDICVHASERTKPDAYGSTGYSMVVHYDKSWKWKSVVRKEAPRDTARPAGPDNPLVPIEVYDVRFTNAKGKEEKILFDARPLWSWDKGITLYLSQYGMRELRWVGDLDEPIPPKEPPSPTVTLAQ